MEVLIFREWFPAKRQKKHPWRIFTPLLLTKPNIRDLASENSWFLFGVKRGGV